MADDPYETPAQPLLPDPARLAEHLTANRQRLLDLFGGVDDIGWGRRARENGGVRWSVRDLLAYLDAAANETRDELDRALAGQSAQRPPSGSRRARRAAQQQVDRRTMIPVTALLASYAASSELLLARLRTLTPEQFARRRLGTDRPAPLTVGSVPAAHWLDTMLAEAALRTALEAAPLDRIASAEEARDLLEAALSLLPSRLSGSLRGIGEIVVRLTGPGRGVWTLRPETGRLVVTRGPASAPDLRLDGPWLPLLLLLTEGRFSWRGPIRVSGPRPWRGLGLWARGG